VTHNQPRDPKDLESGGRFKPRPNLEPDATLEPDEKSVLARVQEKATRSLPRTLAAMRSSLSKGGVIVEMGRHRFDEDWLVQDAAINTVIQLAEEAKRLPISFRDERDGIAWRQLIGMRNILTHDYADVDLSTVWTVLRDQFPIVERGVFSDD
jgi:uncharacterized protein with HEPN domain